MILHAYVIVPVESHHNYVGYLAYTIVGRAISAFIHFQKLTQVLYLDNLPSDEVVTPPA